MIWIGRATGILVFLFSLLLGAAALISPERAAVQLGFAPLTEMGRNSLRADIVALAWGSAILCAGGLFGGRGRWFLGSAALFGIAVSGRILDVLVAGPPDGVARPIIIELILVACALIAARLLPSK
jgi:hypothetical protein